MSTKRRKQVARQRAEAYAAAVVRVLAMEFASELGSATTREIITDAVSRHAVSPADTLEIIVDNPATAAWRLKQDREHPHRVRLAHCPVNPERHDREREDRVNNILAAIPGQD